MGAKPKYAEEGTKKRHPGSRYPPAAVNGSRKHHGSEHDRHYFTYSSARHHLRLRPRAAPTLHPIGASPITLEQGSKGAPA